MERDKWLIAEVQLVVERLNKFSDRVKAVENRVGELGNHIVEVEIYGGGGLKRMEELMERVEALEKEIKSLKRRRKKSSKPGTQTLKISEEKIKQAILGLNVDVGSRCWDLPGNIRVYICFAPFGPGFEASIYKEGCRIMFCHSEEPDYIAGQVYKYLKDTVLVVEKAEVKV